MSSSSSDEFEDAIEQQQQPVSSGEASLSVAVNEGEIRNLEDDGTIEDVAILEDGEDQEEQLLVQDEDGVPEELADDAEQQVIVAAGVEEVPREQQQHNGPELDQARLVVQQIVDELWPLPAPFVRGDDDDDDDDGMDNVEDGYFEEELDGIIERGMERLLRLRRQPRRLWERIFHRRRSRSRNDESDDEGARHDESPDGPPPEFDQELPTRHAYLGSGMEELQGRIVFLDEGATPEIPLIVMGLQLVPGQTLPLTIFHAVFQNAIRRCVAGDRVFGIVHTDLEGMPSGSMVFKGAFGTIAEIYEFQEEDPPSPRRVAEAGGLLPTTFSIKAKGRQRFNVLSFRRQADGNLMGVVKIRPEIRLSPLVQTILFDNTHRYRFPVQRFEAAPLDAAELSPTRIKKRTRTQSNSSDKSMDSEDAEEDTDLMNMRKQIQDRRKITKYYSAFTPFPFFVYEQFEEQCLVERVHRKLRIELKGVTESGSIIPKDANELSFWLALNLAMDDHHRIKILQMDSPVQRLRYELDLLSKAFRVITCRNCLTTIAESSDIFSMSIEGPQGTYVNPHGFVHETVTVHKVKEVLGRGFPSVEASWFPGYAWTIIECRRCSTHLGWKFTAVERMKPKKFWGLARKQVNFKYDFSSNPAEDGDQGMNNEGRTTPMSVPAAADFSLAI